MRCSAALAAAASKGDFEQASSLRENFIPFEDFRDALGPSVVLHHSVELAGITQTGPVTPYRSALSHGRLEQLTPVVSGLLARIKY
jgi:dihydrodipicolinate synthase/N-acetylneuraminate lyase